MLGLLRERAIRESSFVKGLGVRELGAAMRRLGWARRREHQGMLAK